MFQGSLIYILPLLMFHTRINFHQLRVIVYKVKHFFPGEIVSSIKAGVHLAHEFKVFRSIHRPSIIAEVGGVMDQGNFEPARGSASLQLTVKGCQLNIFIKIRHGVLTMLGLFGFLPRLL